MMRQGTVLIGACLVLGLHPTPDPSEDSVMFEAETITIPIGETDLCAQVGLYMSYRGVREQNWNVLNSTLNYIAPEGTLAGTPVVKLSEFGSESPGLTNPGTNHLDRREQQAPCHVPDIANSVTLGRGLEVPFAGGLGNADSSESVNAKTGRIELVASGRGELFSTAPGQKLLFAVITFPFQAGADGSAKIQFVPDSLVKEGNVLANEEGKVLTAYTIDGAVTLSNPRKGMNVWRWGLIVFFVGFLSSLLYNLRRRGNLSVSSCESS